MAEEIEKSGRVPVYGIEFDTGKATIKPASDKILGEIALLLANNADWKLTVEGHTDNVGAKPANLKLSEQRAAAVIDWLVKKGVDKKRLTPKEDEPPRRALQDVTPAPPRHRAPLPPRKWHRRRNRPARHPAPPPGGPGGRGSNARLLASSSEGLAIQ